MKEHKYIEKYCAGCGLCESVLDKKLETIERGFPNISLSPKEDLTFYKSVCPVFYYHQICEQDVWGKVEEAIITYSSDTGIRHKAASGGALTELATYMLESGYVDGVIHTTWDPHNPTKTITCISYTRDEVVARCGSRYSISVPLSRIIQDIDVDKKYAFVGKPCDVMALRSYMDQYQYLQDNIVCLLSFFCAGEPSVDAQKALLQSMGSSFEDCKEITYRGNGWPGYTTVLKKNGVVEKVKYTTSWGQYLGRDLRNICRFCMDGTGEVADIVCADFWCLNEYGKPDFSEHEGRNIAIARTKVGKNILDGALSSGRLVLEENYTDKMGEFHLYQPNQYRRKSTMRSMIMAMKLFGRHVPHYSQSYLDMYARHADFKENKNAFVGIIKRVLKGKL